MVQKVPCKLVGALVDLAICEGTLRRSAALGLNHTLPVWKLLGIGREDLVDG